MAKHLVSLFLICLSVCFIHCAPDPLAEVSTGIDEYIDSMSAQYKTEIQTLDSQITQMESAFAKQLTTVAFSQELAARFARRLESRLASRGTLNVKGKLCIQNFIGNVTAENNGLQAKLRTCVDTARNSAKTLADTAKTHVRNSRQQLIDLVNNDIATCRKSNANNMQKLTDCSWDRWKARENNIINYLKAGGKEIEGAVCKADALAKTAQECSFTHLLDTQTITAEVLMNFNACVGDKIVEIRN